MSAIAELNGRIEDITNKLNGWRRDAERIRKSANKVLDSRTVSADRLVEVEEIAGAIYREIEQVDMHIGQATENNPNGAAQMAEIGEALRLVLMDITEFGTSMYSVNSDIDGEPPAPTGVTAG